MHRGSSFVRRTTVRSAALIAFAGLALAACSSPPSGSSSGSSGSSSSSGNVIKIGFDAEQTGAIASFGVSFLQGAKAAVANVNQNLGGVTINGKKYKFELDVCNDNSDQTQVAACVTKLVNTDGDKFVFGGLADYGPVVRGITEPNHAIYFSTGSAVAALMSQSHYVVNTVPSLPARSLMSVVAFKKAFPNAKTVGLLEEQDATDQAAFADLLPAFKQEGLKVVGTEIAPLDATDYSSFLTSLKADHPDVIWNELASSPDSEPDMLQQNASLHAASIIFNNSGSCVSTYPHTPGITYLGETNAGAIGVGPLETSNTKEYYKLYYSMPGVSNPDPNSAAGLFIYDFFGVLAKAIEKAGTFTSVPDVLKAINQVTYKGANGTITTHNNQSTYGQVICYATDGNSSVKEFEAFPDGTTTGYSS